MMGDPSDVAGAESGNGTAGAGIDNGACAGEECCRGELTGVPAAVDPIGPIDSGATDPRGPLELTAACPPNK